SVPLFSLLFIYSPWNGRKPLFQFIYLFKEDLNYAYKLGKELEHYRHKFSQIENNLLNHFWGIYYIMTKDGKKSLEFLSNISRDYYHLSIEIDYHLSLAYSLNSSALLSYYYGSKALEHFHKHKLFNRIIDAEIVLCMQLARGDKNEILLSISKLKELLELSSSDFTKAIILHNIGFSFMKLKNYAEAIKYYDEALKYKKRDTYLYLTSYYAKLFSKILNNDIVTKLEAERGLNISRKVNSKKYEILFQTMLLYIDNDGKLYHFLKSKAFDYFINIKLEDHVDFYGKKLIDYYKSKNNLDKALYIAEKLINAKKM
ncbi:tetratricopeptide repeat protein, partial [Parageobacillus toebii]